MPIRQIPGTGADYYLIVFDENGNELESQRMSAAILKRLADKESPVTDIFLASHGWKGDIPGAIEQYDLWFSTMASMADDVAAMHAKRPVFNPLVVGLHWPSLPWGDETLPPGKPGRKGKLGGKADDVLDADECARQIAPNKKRALSAIKAILAYSRTARTAALTPEIADAYAEVFAASGLRTGSLSGRPGSDQAGFDADTVVREAAAQLGSPAGKQTLGETGILSGVRDAILMPLRQLSFWKMKDRARRFGEGGVHELIKRFQLEATDVYMHLMGHSFGSIVASAAVAGPDASADSALPRPVNTLYLVEGALSLWSFASDIPYAPGGSGYFSRIVEDELVHGAIVTTQSTYDTAVGRFYPLGAEVAGQLKLGEEWPAYGGIGTFGIRGIEDVADLKMQAATASYDFLHNRVYNLDASDVIKNGNGASGAHSDIAHPEVAHAFWAAVTAIPTQGKQHLKLSVKTNESVAGPWNSDQSIGPLLSVSRHNRRASSVLKKMAMSGPRNGRSKARDNILHEAVVDGSPGLLGEPYGFSLQKSKITPKSRRVSSGDPQRWVNVQIEGHAPRKALKPGEWYTLAFDIDIEQRVDAKSAPISERGLFAPDINEVVLTVQIDSPDFELSGQTSHIRLPRTGRSRTKARFDLSPRHRGPSTVNAVILKDGNFVQQLTLTFNIGEKGDDALTIDSRGRPLGNVDALQERDVCLTIRRNDDYYECSLRVHTVGYARLNFDAAYIAKAIDVARAGLMRVVDYHDGTGYPFQAGISISAKAEAFALETMANAGAALFRKLFYAPGATADSIRLGDYLQKLATQTDQQLNLQIVAERVTVPWGMLYVGPVTADAKLDWNNFLGMRHVIEQIPLQNSWATVDNNIPSKPPLAVSINVNDTIDKQMDARFVADQIEYWSAVKGIDVASRRTSGELLQALNQSTTRDQIVYLYCHATSKGLDDDGGPDASYLGLSDKQLTLGELQGKAPVRQQLAGNPLVFLNACESVEMSPTFYDGFVPYFMDKGARGVIGTECQTPALFAVEWATHFFERLLSGEPIGKIFLALRRDFLRNHRNPLGLIYAVYCDSDTRVEPAVKSTASVATPFASPAQLESTAPPGPRRAANRSGKERRQAGLASDKQ